MADTPTTPTVTPDAATTSTPDQSQQAPPPAAGAAPPPPAPAAPQPPAQAAQSAPAAAPAATKPSGNVWKNVIEGALGGLAKTGKVLGRGVGTELNTWARNSPRGQELQQNALVRKGEIQRQQLAQSQEQRAQSQEQREQESHMSEEKMKAAQLAYYNTQEIGQTYANSLAKAKLPAELQEIQDRMNEDQTELIEAAEDQGYTFNKEHGTSFDNLGVKHAQDLVSGQVFALNNGLTGKDHGLVLGSVPEARQSPLIKDTTVTSGWDFDPDTGNMIKRQQTLKAGDNTIMDLITAHHNATREFNEKYPQAKALIENRETTGGGGTTKALIKFEQDPSEMAGDKAQDAISAAQTALNDPSTTPDLKARWQKILNTATSTQKLTEDQKSREQQRAAEIQAGGQNAIDDQAEQLVNGDMDPTQMTKRSSAYNQILKAADDYSIKSTGKRFDLAQAQSDFKYATTPATQNTLKYLNSVIPNMSDLVRQSNALERTQLPALNNVAAWGRIQTGDPKMAAYNATITEVSDQIAKILQGGGSGNGTSDAKLKQAQELFNTGFNPEQVKAVVGELQNLLGTRKQALIGNNRYLKKQYGSASSNPQVPVGKVPAYNKRTGAVIGYADDAQGTNFQRF